MKAILRKGMVACATMLMGTNVMAQSFDLTKELQLNLEALFEGGVVSPVLTKDGNPRLIIVEETEGNGEDYDENGNYTYTCTMDKLSILNNNLETEKEFTSGPLFEEFVNVTAESAAKTLKVESVDTVYAGEEALARFYSSFSVRIYNEEAGYNEWYDYSDLVGNFTEDEVRGYVKKWLEESSYSDTTFLGERFLFESYYVKESDYFDWGTQYPTDGWIYKDHDDICRVRINYVADELEEISRYNSSVYSAYYNADLYYVDFTTEGMNANGVISQSLFNDDEKYEFLLPELAILESSYSSYDGTLTTHYNYEPIGYKVVSEDGTVLYRLMINEAKENDVRCYAYVTSLGDKNYLMVNSYKRVPTDYGDYYTADWFSRFYEIKKGGSGTNIQKVREMRGGMNIRPTVANRDEQITITLDEENSSVARELVVTSVNGQLVSRRTIPAGENTIQVNAAMMRSGMYNFTLQKKGQVVDNGKVIVK